MKKLFSISIIAILAMSPIMAHAEDDPVEESTPVAVAGDPGATVADAPVAEHDPKYGLKEANAEVDNNLATAGYVKGAYNATIKAINKLDSIKQDKLTADQITAIGNVTTISGDVNALKTTVGNSGSGLVKRVTDLETTVGDASAGLVKRVTDLEAVDNATEAGAAATAAAAVNGATIDLSGIQPVTGKVGGTASASITVMDTWGSDTPAANPVTAEVNLNSTSVVTGLTGNSANQANKISAGTVTYHAN